MRFIALFFAVLMAFATSPAARAEPPEKGFRAGVDLGGVGLLGDLHTQGMRFGAGLALAYQFSDTVSLDVDYFGASFDDVDHRDLDIGASYYIPDMENQFHVSGGASFLHNDFKLLSRSGDAVGVYVGAGASWALMPRFRAGLDLRLHKAAQAKATYGGADITTVSDSATAMLKLTYTPDFSD